MTQFDISQLSFLEWLDYTFDRQVRLPEWYWETTYDPYTGDHSRIIENCSKLFSDPSVAASRYSREQLVQGFWFINGYRGFTRFLADPNVSAESRVECLNAMKRLFLGQFVKDPLDETCFMWFDCVICSGIYVGRSFLDDFMLRNKLLDILVEILDFDSRECQRAALHGLNHMWHRAKDDVEGIIDRFMDTHMDIEPEVIEYAIRCRNGAMP